MRSSTLPGHRHPAPRPLRTATVPAEDRPVTFGVHGAVAEHYGTDPDTSPPHATTLDYLVAAAAG